MKLTLDDSKTYAVFIPGSAAEAKLLANFPGCVKRGGYRVAPAKLTVVFNLVQRLRAKKVAITFAPGLEEWISQPYTLAQIPADFTYHTPPIVFQEIALRYIYTAGSAGLLLAPGMGKSKVILDYIHLMKFKKTCIVCPKPLMFVWEDEIKKHRPELNYYGVETTDWAVESPKILAAQVTIINYTKATTFEEELKKVGYDFIHLDEFLIKNFNTARTKSMLSLGKTIPYRAGGSGTLINNTPIDGYAPVRFLEPALVGENYGNFFNAHTVKKEMTDKSGVTRSGIVAYKGVKEIKSILESCCIVMSKEEWLKLPEKRFIDIQVQLSPDQKEKYYSLMRNYYVKIGDDHIEVDNALVMMSKLYQISNGFVYAYKETDKDILIDLLADDAKTKKKKSDRKTYFFPENPKAEALKTLITEKLKQRRMIIWFNLEAEDAIIEKALNEIGVTSLSIKGGEKDIGGKVRRFNKDQTIQVLRCQAKSVNYGITVLGSKSKDLEDEGIEVLPNIDTQIYTQIFYSLNFSLEVYLQQQDRIHRLGQDHECEYYRLFSNTPIERKIRMALDDKMALRTEMLVDVAQTLLKESLEDSIS